MKFNFGINWDKAYVDALQHYPDLNFNIPVNECNSVYPGYYESTQCRIISYLFDHRMLNPSDYATGYVYYSKDLKCLPESYYYAFLEQYDAELLNKIILTGEITASYLVENLCMSLESLRDCLSEITLLRFSELRNVVTPQISQNMLAEVYTILWQFLSNKDPEETIIIRNSIAESMTLPRSIPLYIRTFLALVYKGFIKDSQAKQCYQNLLMQYSVPVP